MEKTAAPTRIRSETGGRPANAPKIANASAEHGYALPERDIHDKMAANRDWELIFAMFRRQISA